MADRPTQQATPPPAADDTVQSPKKRPILPPMPEDAAPAKRPSGRSGKDKANGAPVLPPAPAQAPARTPITRRISAKLNVPDGPALDAPHAPPTAPTAPTPARTGRPARAPRPSAAPAAPRSQPVREFGPEATKPNIPVVRDNPPAPVAAPVARPAAPRPVPVAAAAPQTPARRPVRRRAKLRLTRIDPWSVIKTAFLLSVAFGIVSFIAVLTVWGVLGALGVWDSVNSSVQDLVGGDSGSGFDVQNYVGLPRVLGLTTLVSVLDVALLTAAAALMAFLYNLAAALLGGIEVTLTEDEH